jgi:hypothetical protein
MITLDVIAQEHHFKRLGKNLIEVMESLIKEMPDKGDKEEDSQKICLLNKLHDFEMTVNGTQPDDFIAIAEE